MNDQIHPLIHSTNPTQQLIQAESSVRSYCRNFPKTFVRSQGSYLYDEDGREYLDFLSGCGSLNYGHNNPILKASLIEHISRDGLSMSMDLETQSKRQFLSDFSSMILAPRGLRYRQQFTGPTGANAIEAAIKIARKVTGRTNVIAFTNAFHGCSLGALSLTGSRHHRSNSSCLLNQVTRFPFDGYFGNDSDTADFLRKMLEDPSSGIDSPAAIVIETVQGEGGLNTCTNRWAKKIQDLARDFGSLLIVDDIQAGCGRTGTFFSFEDMQIEPDVVCLAKAISGYGLPMSLVLLKPEHDQWSPGEHNGTFRGNNFAFVTGAQAIRHYWSDGNFERDTKTRAEFVSSELSDIARSTELIRGVKGRGLMQGLEFSENAVAARVQRRCFNHGLVIELCGPRDEVLKFLPPLNCSLDDLERGASIVADSVRECDSLAI